jgi:hypothetical protein
MKGAGVAAKGSGTFLSPMVGGWKAPAPNERTKNEEVEK